jgi:DNA transformation protein
MAVSAAYLDTLKDLLSPRGMISVRRMFGGAGIYCDGTIFGLVADDVLHLKVDETTRARFEAEGCGPFQYQLGDGTMQSLASYHRAPDRLVDEPDELLEWARHAILASRRAASANPRPRQRPPGRRARKSRTAPPR